MNLGATINTASAEFVPAFSPDGHWMFFASDRAGGFGRQDIYQSYRADIHDDFGWQTPTNLGANVNTAADDNGVHGYFENGGHPQLFFGSGRLGGAARDLFLSNLQADGTWGPATLIPELSSPATENRPSIRQDGLEIFFYSDRPGGSGDRSVDRNASHRRRTLVDAGQPRRDREQQRRATSTPTCPRTGGRSSSARLAPAASGASTST